MFEIFIQKLIQNLSLFDTLRACLSVKNINL